MEVKWLMIGWAAMIIGMSASAAYEAKTKADCRTSFAQSNKTAEEINTICGK